MDESTHRWIPAKFIRAEIAWFVYVRNEIFVIYHCKPWLIQSTSLGSFYDSSQLYIYIYTYIQKLGYKCEIYHGRISVLSTVIDYCYEISIHFYFFAVIFRLIGRYYYYYYYYYCSVHWHVRETSRRGYPERVTALEVQNFKIGIRIKTQYAT